MLRRKTIIVLAITLMVTVMVAAFSYLYISQILRLRITSANETANSLTHQLAYAVSNAVPDFSSTSVDTSNSAAVRRAFADYVQTGVALNNLLQSDPGDWRFIYDVTIVDVSGKALLHTNASMVGKVIAPRPDFQRVVSARFLDQLRLVFSSAEVYDVTYPLEMSISKTSPKPISQPTVSSTARFSISPSGICSRSCCNGRISAAFRLYCFPQIWL